METTGANYNPHQLIELRDINDGVESFHFHKATELEYKLEELKQAEKRISALEAVVNQIKSHMTLDEWYSDYKDKDEVLEALMNRQPRERVRPEASSLDVGEPVS
mgnify:CR=1 FL=1